MFNNKAQVEWEFRSEEERDEPWPPARQGSRQENAARQHHAFRRYLMLVVAMAVLLTTGIGAVYARNEALQGIQEVERGVQAAVDAEKWVQEEAPELSADLLVDDVASTYVNWMVDTEQRLLSTIANGEPPNPSLRIEDTWFVDRSAAVEVVVTMPSPQGGAPAVYRQTRFYRETERGWLRTQPEPRLWGTPGTLETSYLIWRYRQRDAAAVAEIADAMDAFYDRLLRDYGLSEPGRSDKPVVHVQVDALPRLILLYTSPDEEIVVASPSIYLMPAGHSDAKILEQAAVLAILKHMWAEAVAQHGIEDSWPSMPGVSLWELWETGLELSEWEDVVVHWAFGEAAADAADQSRLPADYVRMCTALSAWMRTPMAVGIPLFCDGRNDTVAHARSVTLAGLDGEPLSLRRAATLHHSGPIIPRIENPLVIYSVVDYAVSTYGEESLPALVAALGQHGSWDTLVRAVFRVSLDEFEQGWQHHIETMAQ